MAKCEECDSTLDLYVYYIPDPYTGYPLLAKVICAQCPPSTSTRAKYKPRIHDKLLGLSDYNVCLSYAFSGTCVTKGLCFECDKEINMEKGYGHRYVPDEYWLATEQTSVIYCKSCYTTLCKNHWDFTQPQELAKLNTRLALYRERTINGQLQ